MNHLNLAILATLSILTVSSHAFADEPQGQQAAEFVLSEGEFQKQRTFMLEDLAQKIELLQTAHSCADKAKTSADFTACNKALQDGMHATISKQSSK